MCALEKFYEYGTKKGNYWKVLSLYPDTDHGQTQGKVVLYPDIDSRKVSEFSYVITKMFSVDKVTNSRAEFYDELKNKGFFNDSKDV